jgi:hypothetical protein
MRLCNLSKIIQLLDYELRLKLTLPSDSDTTCQCEEVAEVAIRQVN